MSETMTGSRTQVQGVLAEKNPDGIVLALPGTDYRLALVVDAAGLARLSAAGAGARVSGTIHARARRVDVMGSGGRFIEPVFGRPRRLQGRVTAVDDRHNTITVAAACPVVCELTDSRQKAGDFAEGMLVGFDVEKGARFDPA